MFKHTLLKRSLVTALTIGAASFPAAAQARYLEDPPASASGPKAPLVSRPSVTTTSQSGFQWGDAGIGAAGALLLVAIGSGTAVTVRRRSGPLAG